MVVGVRVVSENIQTGKRTHCNSSYFTMVAKDNGKSVPVPGIILSDVTAVRRFARSIRRQEETESRIVLSAKPNLRWLIILRN